MAVTYTNASSEKLINPSYIVATLYGSSDADGTPTGDAYVLEDIVRDTTEASQDDNDVNDIECETSDSPIYTSVKRGQFQISAEIADTQSDLLVALGGFTEDSDGNVYAPAKYKPIYAKIDIVYELSDGTYTAMVYPKVQLNTKLMVESLNSDINRIQLAGTARDITLTVGEDTIRTPFYKSPNYTLPS